MGSSPPPELSPGSDAAPGARAPGVPPPPEGEPAAEELDRKLGELERLPDALGSTGPGERRLTPELVRQERARVSGFEFGAYRIEGEIARGGMGVLYRARQAHALAADPKLRLPEEVALKVIMTRAGAQAAAADIERFIREIRVLITITHPNIVRIWDAGKENGLHYYTMELISGESLKELVRDRPLPLVMSLAIVREIASALAALHAVGLLHRDVKPANILIDRAASPFRPVLIDFGLIKGSLAGEKAAALAGKRPAGGGGGGGEVAGTPAYMAPEATEPGGAFGPVGPASDLYSLGAVLYFLLTRRSPFVGSRAADVLEEVRTKAPKAPREIVRALPQPVEAIVLRCLAKRPEDRFRDMRALMAALDAEIEGSRRAIRFENLFLRIRRRILGRGG